MDSGYALRTFWNDGKWPYSISPQAYSGVCYRAPKNRVGVEFRGKNGLSVITYLVPGFRLDNSEPLKETVKITAIQAELGGAVLKLGYVLRLATEHETQQALMI
jgi:hypothetical protein